MENKIQIERDVLDQFLQTNFVIKTINNMAYNQKYLTTRDRLKLAIDKNNGQINEFYS